MEDLFQIIIIVIFILSSIVSSMNKKKKQQQKNKSNKLPSQTDVQNSKPKKKQKTTAEILEEMLGLKIELPEPPVKEAPKSYPEGLERSAETWDPANDFKDYSEENLSRAKDKEVYKSSLTSEDKNKFRLSKEEIKHVRSKAQPTKIQKLFSDQSNLKKYILIQEILNKPKALRK